MAMNNEPVAWKVIETDDEGSFTTFTEVEPVRTDNAVPLYTHPAKTDKYIADLKNLVDAQGQNGTWDSNQYMLGLFNGLELALSIFESREPKFRELPAKTLTDEEILDICIVGGFYDRIEDPFFDKKTGAWSLDEDLIEFARAILRKAQEK